MRSEDEIRHALEMIEGAKKGGEMVGAPRAGLAFATGQIKAMKWMLGEDNALANYITSIDAALATRRRAERQ